MSLVRSKIETIEIDFGAITYKFITANLPIEIINEYYGYNPYIKNVNDIPNEISETNTIARRLKVNLIDELVYINPAVSTSMASFWRLFIARNKNYKGKIIRYYRRVGDGALQLRFSGKVENMKIDTSGNMTIEAVDMLKAMSKVDYPFMTGVITASDFGNYFVVNSFGALNSLNAVVGDYALVTDPEFPSMPPTYYILTALPINEPSNWVSVGTVYPVKLYLNGDITDFEASGYLKLGKEIISYGSIGNDITGNYLDSISRGLFESEVSLHYTGTMIYHIINIAVATDVFTQMKKILEMVGLTSSYLTTSFDTYAALGLLNITAPPIIKNTKLSNLYFDLVNIADCISYQNEAGLVDVLRLSEMPATYVEITDESNLIYNTPELDLNEKSRFTRWLLYWNRVDLTKEIDDDDAYGRGNLTVDGDAETLYGDVVINKQYSAFLNAPSLWTFNSTEIDAINTYVNALLEARRTRTNEAQWILAASLEIKDDDIKLGQVVKIQTQKVLDEDGVPALLKYRVIKKEPLFNKIKFTFKRVLV